MKKIMIGLGIVGATPFVALADVEDLSGLANNLVGLVNSIIPLLFGIALVAFFWGVIQYIWSADTEKIKEAREYMLYSIISISVMLSVWGLALFLKNSFFPSAHLPYDPSSGQSGFSNDSMFSGQQHYNDVNNLNPQDDDNPENGD